jgi:hypothetical protein
MRYGCSCAAKGCGSKKTLFALEQGRVDVARRRRRWRSWQTGLDPQRLVFIDETWTKTNMTPLRGWAPQGARLRGFAPHGRWRTMTFLGALRYDRLAAPCLFDGPINGECFRAYVEQILLPSLKPGDVVIMDMCGRPRWCKKNLSKSTERGRVLTCVRPFCCGCHMPLARMGVRGTGPIQPRVLEARIHDLVFPILSRDRCAILSD